MGLSNDLISQFVKTTKDTSKTKKEEIVYGTVKMYNGEKYVQLDGSDLLTPITSTMIIDENDRVTVVIKNHTATVTGNITHPGASGQLVESTIGQMDSIITDNAVIKEKLEATEGKFVILEADYAIINEKLIAAEAAIRVLDTEKLSADQADIKYATIVDLNATNAKIYNLEATYGDFTVLTTEKFEALEAVIEVLDAGKASIDDLDAIRAQINVLDAEKADIDDLTAGNIKFDTASGGTLDVQTLLARFITGENAQFLNLTSANTTIANAMIKDAMIASLSVSKLTSGTINTNNINIASDDNSMVISDGTIIFYDKDGNVRLQIGENAEGDFDIILIGADGSSTLLDSTGIKEDAIADKLIKTEMINDKAVGADQINYESFISGLNADGTGELIKSSKVELDGTGQTLSVVFNQMETKVEDLQDQLDNLEIPEGVDGLKETVTTHTTAINVIQGQISTLVSENTIIKGDITEIENNYTTMDQTVDSIKTTVNSHESAIGELEQQVTVNTSSIEQLQNEINLKVNYSDIQNAIKDIKVGGRNLILNSTWKLGIDTNWTTNNNFSLLDPEPDKPNSPILYISKTGLTTNLNAQKWSKEVHMTDVGNTEYTFSFDFKTADWSVLNSIGVIRTFNETGKTAQNDSAYYYNISTSNVTVEKVVNEWVRVSVTVKPTAGKYIRFGVYQSRNGTCYFRELKAETGNVPTDWMCAPEDIEADYISKIENIQNQVTTNTSEIQILKNQITLKVSSTDFNSLKTTVQTNTSTIQTLETSVESNTSSIEVLQGQIDLKVESTDIQEAIETIRFGGRNYIQFSDFVNNTSEWVQSKGAENTGTSTVGDGVMTITSAGSSYIQRQIYSNRKATALNDLMIGETYTLSVEVKVEVHPSRIGTLMDLRYNKLDNTTSSQIVIADDLTNVELNKWIKLEKTGTITWDPANFNYWRVIIQGVLGGKIHFRKPKLELGTKSTDWTAAPEDTNTAIKDIETKVTTNQTNIANMLIDMNSITSRVSSTETTVSTLNGNVTNLTSRVNTAEQKLTAEALTTTISTAIENGTSDISTTEFVMDKDGLTIKNGAIIVKNNAGDVVLEGDTNGNLMLKGTITVDTTNDEQIIVLSESSDLPIMKAMDHGLYAKSLTVADSVGAWEDNRAWTGVEILPSGIIANTGTVISANEIDVNNIQINGKLTYFDVTAKPSNTSYWTQIAIMEVEESYGESYMALEVTNTGDSRNETQYGVLYCRLSVQGDMGYQDNIMFDMNLIGGGKETSGMNVTHFRAQVSVCTVDRVMVTVYACAGLSNRSWHFKLSDWYGRVFTYSNSSYKTLSSSLTTYTPTNIFVSQEIRANTFRTRTSSSIYMLVSNEGASNTGLYITSTGAVRILKNGTAVHEFKTDGTKTGGSMEIDGIRYGMSPTDSPQTLIEYIVPDVAVAGITKVPLDDIYKKMVSYYIVMSSNPDVRVKEKTSDYILLSGTGTTDLLIKGQRKGADEHFRIMNDLKDE